jgi:hypothetical protein
MRWKLAKTCPGLVLSFRLLLTSFVFLAEQSDGEAKPEKV